MTKLGFIIPLAIALVIVVGGWLGVSGTLSGGKSILAGQRPAQLGVAAQGLASCPATPNCVSSQSEDAAHQIAPLAVPGDPTQAIAAIQTIVESLPRTTIVTSTETYLYVEFSSALMGFVDDVEFYATADGVQVRSASRLGESDLGVNRKRIEDIRAMLQQTS